MKSDIRSMLSPETVLLQRFKNMVASISKHRIFNWRSVFVPLAAAAFMVSSLPAVEPCRIRIVDGDNGWPVPLVELRTTHNVRFVSDNTGQIAFDLPELMGVETWFHIEGHGYTVEPDGFGLTGVRFAPRAGETKTIQVKRTIEVEFS